MDALIPITFESSLGSRRLSFKRTTYADESLRQVFFGGLTVLLASSGDQVSFYTTVGVWGEWFGVIVQQRNDEQTKAVFSPFC